MRYFLTLLFSSLVTFLMAQSYVDEIALHRDAYKAKFLKYDQSPLDTTGLEKISFYDADPKYRVDCAVEYNANTKEVVIISTYAGKEKQYLKHARFTCPLGEETIQLVAYKSVKHLRHPIYSKMLFIPFKDHTNGEGSYGGGRYIDFPLSEIVDGKATLDLNKAYNPWCAYADGFNCPIPPLENHLSLKIEAGEREYKR